MPRGQKNEILLKCIKERKKVNNKKSGKRNKKLKTWKSGGSCLFNHIKKRNITFCKKKERGEKKKMTDENREQGEVKKEKRTQNKRN